MREKRFGSAVGIGNVRLNELPAAPGGGGGSDNPHQNGKGFFLTHGLQLRAAALSAAEHGIQEDAGLRG